MRNAKTEKMMTPQRNFVEKMKDFLVRHDDVDMNDFSLHRDVAMRFKHPPEKSYISCQTPDS